MEKTEACSSSNNNTLKGIRCCTSDCNRSVQAFTATGCNLKSPKDSEFSFYPATTTREMMRSMTGSITCTS